MKYPDAWRELRMYMNVLEHHYSQHTEYDRELVMVKAFKNTLDALEEKHE